MQILLKQKAPKVLGFVPKCARRQQLGCFFSTDSTDEIQVQQTKARRRRRSTNFTRTEDIPSYKEFVHRHNVLSLYRNFLREVKALPSSNEELRDQVTREFKANKGITDPFNLKWTLSEGKRRLEEIQQYTGGNSRMNDADSWINTPDPEDPRGRVGAGWPWQR